MIKQKKLKIKSVRIEPSNAGYNPYTHEIFYDKTLNNFPEFKKFVLNHERQHAKKPFNLWWHIYLDTRDYTKQCFRNDFHQYLAFNLKNDTDGRRLRGWMHIFYYIYHLFFSLFYSILISITGIYFKFKKSKTR